MRIRPFALTFLAAVVAVAPGASALDPLTQQRAMDRYRAGQELLSADNFAAAADEFRAALELDPDMALAHYGLGQSYMGLKTFGEAIAAFQRCRTAYTSEAAGNQQRIARMDRWIHDEIRGLEDTKRQIDNRLRGPGLTPSVQRELVRAQQRVQMRLETLDRMRYRTDRVQEAPPGVTLALGSAYLRAGKLAEAEREYQAALSSNPKMGEAHNNLAYVYMVTGRLQDAERAMKLAEKSGFRVHPEFKAELKQKLQ